MLRRTHGHTIPASPTEATGCTACGTPGQQHAGLIPLSLAGFETPALVCPDPVMCRRRAEARGIYKAVA